MPIQGRDCTVSALTDEKGPLELRVFPTKAESILGNIYVAQVETISENIGAAFLLIQPGVRCYLPVEEGTHAIYAGEQKGVRLRPGDQLLVQVKREAMKTKLPCVTTNLNFTGKYLVLTSGNSTYGFSGKLTKEEKKRLGEWLPKDEKAGYGLIVRTNARDASKEEISRELAGLRKRYDQVTVYGRQRTCFSLLEEAQSPVLSALRDTYTKDLEEIVTDDPAFYESIAAYLKKSQEEEMEKLRFYNSSLLPLYKLHRLEHGLASALKERVWLDSGGFLVIQPTEAFVSIDVNTGKYAGRKKVQETYRKINKEAAVEIARQLRLRNLSGMILIDFINMENPQHREELFHILGNLVRKDPVKTQVIDITALHIVEVTRKKVRRSLAEEVAEITGRPQKEEEE